MLNTIIRDDILEEIRAAVPVGIWLGVCRFSLSDFIYSFATMWQKYARLSGLSTKGAFFAVRHSTCSISNGHARVSCGEVAASAKKRSPFSSKTLAKNTGSVHVCAAWGRNSVCDPLATPNSACVYQVPSFLATTETESIASSFAFKAKNQVPLSTYLHVIQIHGEMYRLPYAMPCCICPPWAWPDSRFFFVTCS